MARLMIWAGAAALAVTPFAMAHANGAEPTPFADQKVTLNSDGLDLSTQQGRAVMDSRIARAANRICGVSVNHLGPLAVTKARQCRQEVIEEVEARIYQL